MDVDVYAGKVDTDMEMNEGILFYPTSAPRGNSAHLQHYNAVIASEPSGAHIEELLNYTLSPYEKKSQASKFKNDARPPAETFVGIYGTKGTSFDMQTSLKGNVK